MSNSLFTKYRTPAIIVCVVLLAGAFVYYRSLGGGPPTQEGARPLAVRVAKAKIDTVPVYFNALGTVTPPRTVTVKSRVDGELIGLHFEEGQKVREGQLLAEIDPRPFEVQKTQALGNLAKNEALLKDATLDLERYRKLIKERSISQQQLQSQEALVGQYVGSVTADKASVADAELQLTYSRITAPVTGRVGLRKVDVGNIIRASDSDGIVVITQMQPMDVVFTLVEKQIPDVVEAMRRDSRLLVEAWGQDSTKKLAAGYLASMDNQIDTSTGTVKAKAVFDNEDELLFPNQFVNIRLRVKQLDNVLTIPSSAVQRNNKGFFVYVVEDGKTRMQELELGYATDRISVVGSGLQTGDIVVTDGVDRLREGSPVSFRQRRANGTKPVAADGKVPEKAGAAPSSGISSGTKNTPAADAAETTAEPSRGAHNGTNGEDAASQSGESRVLPPADGKPSPAGNGGTVPAVGNATISIKETPPVQGGNRFTESMGAVARNCSLHVSGRYEELSPRQAPVPAP